MHPATSDRRGSSLERMQCMEVWGGNSEVQRTFEMPGLETWVYSHPHGGDRVGGDVYYLSSCASGRISRLLLADVSGHGQEVADLAVGLRDLMRKNVNVVRQTRFVEGMNRQFARLAEQGAFATALVATFFQPARRLSLCNAGHPHPLYYSAAARAWSIVGDVQNARPGPANLPLGLHEQTVYEQSEMLLGTDDLALFYSDALTEACDAEGHMFGMAGLLRLVESLPCDAPATLITRLLAALQANHPDNLHRDDLTIMLCRATGTGTTLRDNLLAPLRLLRSVGDNTMLR